MSTDNICFCGEIRNILCGYTSYLEVWVNFPAIESCQDHGLVYNNMHCNNKLE